MWYLYVCAYPLQARACMYDDETLIQLHADACMYVCVCICIYAPLYYKHMNVCMYLGFTVEDSGMDVCVV